LLQEKEALSLKEKNLKKLNVKLASTSVEGFKEDFGIATRQVVLFSPTLDATKFDMFKDVVDGDLFDC